MRTGCAATPSLWMSVTISLRLWICCQDQQYDGPILPPSERNVQSITVRPYQEQTMSCQGDVMPSHNHTLRPLTSQKVYETLKKKCVKQCWAMDKPDLESYYDHIYNLELLLSDMIPAIYHFFYGYWHFFAATWLNSLDLRSQTELTAWQMVLVLRYVSQRITYASAAN